MTADQGAANTGQPTPPAAPTDTVRPTRLWYAVGMVLLSILAVAGACIWYTNHVASRQCDAWRAEVAVYQETPPTTETGKRLAAAKVALIRVNC